MTGIRSAEIAALAEVYPKRVYEIRKLWDDAFKAPVPKRGNVTLRLGDEIHRLTCSDDLAAKIRKEHGSQPIDADSYMRCRMELALNAHNGQVPPDTLELHSPEVAIDFEHWTKQQAILTVTKLIAQHYLHGPGTPLNMSQVCRKAAVINGVAVTSDVNEPGDPLTSAGKRVCQWSTKERQMHVAKLPFSKRDILLMEVVWPIHEHLKTLCDKEMLANAPDKVLAELMGSYRDILIMLAITVDIHAGKLTTEAEAETQIAELKSATEPLIKSMIAQPGKDNI